MDLLSFRQVASIMAWKDLYSSQHTKINFPEDISVCTLQALINSLNDKYITTSDFDHIQVVSQVGQI